MKPTLSQVDSETLRLAAKNGGGDAAMVTLIGPERPMDLQLAAQNALTLVDAEMVALAGQATKDPAYITPPTTEESIVLRSGNVEYVLMNLVEKVSRDDEDDMVVQ